MKVSSRCGIVSAGPPGGSPDIPFLGKTDFGPARAMLFQTTEFLVFYLIILLSYFVLLKRHRVGVLLAASYYFYMSWDYRFGSLILISTVIDYYCCIRIEDSSDASGARRGFLLFSMITNLGILAFFKYFGFFVDSFLDLAALFGWRPDVVLPTIILPVGISFFTFQSMSHTIDVYRREMGAERDFARFALYVAFFPQLVAGPIVRASDFLPQLNRRVRFNPVRLHWGLERILIGLIKKVVIADNLSAAVDLVYADPSAFDTKMVWFATLCYAFQIYCDFSGYSDMAIGLARILGFKFQENFNLPYLSATPSEFWRRWHISLSTWLRDYLYISLGGNRGGSWYTLRNLMLTMILGGLWHGAKYNFILWGAWHGLLLVAFRILEQRWSGFERLTRGAARIPMVALMFVLVITAWVPFRAATLTDTMAALRIMYLDWNFSFNPEGIVHLDFGFMWMLMAAVTLGNIICWFGREALARAESYIAWRSCGLAVMVFIVIHYSHIGETPFVYFQF